ncbi:helix-turn-helix domain-containing protein [Streptomyces sp. NRRL F-5630]|uniref:helix-turn-helix domain-containing protein n=1 Tax=Streptomyces sp. NRRL F-5630 TaxID=1463864 RepID=UPI003EB82514
MKNLLGRRASHPGRAPRPTSHAAPWWVRAFTSGGRPVVAVVVLIMCAPGEHHLAVLAGWDARLAWGMAAVLAAYAGIAASVATNRPSGSPGRWSAIIGAGVSLAAAMAAQPVSHLFVTGHWSATPHAPAWLVITVSAVPPLVLGHLLHLAATPTGHAPAASRASRLARPLPAIVPAGVSLLPLVARDAQSRTETPARRGPSLTWVTVPPHAMLLPLVPLDRETPDADEETPRDADDDEPSGRRLIETREVAALHNVKPSTVRTWVDRGRLRPVVRDARGGMLFDRDDVAALGGAR